MSFKELCHVEQEEWKELRKTGIGASEMAAVLGESKFKSALELYYEKTGEIGTPDISNKEHVFWGNKLEKVIIDVIKERTGRNVIHSGCLLRSCEYPWALCTLDAWYYDHEGILKYPCEIKTTSSFNADEWSNGPPEMYIIQCQQQMLVTGTTKDMIACLIGGQQLVWSDVHRNEYYINKIIKAGNEFWQRVQDRNPPLPDGSDSANLALGTIYNPESLETVDLDGSFIDLDIELDKMKKDHKQLSKNVSELEQKIKAAIGNAYMGVLPNGIAYTWTTTHKTEYTQKATSYRVLRRKAPKGK